MHPPQALKQKENAEKFKKPIKQKVADKVDAVETPTLSINITYDDDIDSMIFYGDVVDLMKHGVDIDGIVYDEKNVQKLSVDFSVKRLGYFINNKNFSEQMSADDFIFRLNLIAFLLF